jgi:glutamate racemase
MECELSADSRVLVFDSGVGALSVIGSIRKRFPFLNIDFLSDDLFFPYGEKVDQVLVRRVSEVITRQWETEKFDLLVVACNTASTVCLPQLREILKVPVVGVVPAVKPAVADSLSRSVGLLATTATVGRKYTHDLIQRYAKDCSVFMHGSTALVYQAEKKVKGEPVDPKIIYEELQTLLRKDEEGKMDRIVLGCTHFPLLIEELEQSLNERQIVFVDSGEAIASRIGSLLRVFAEKTGRVGTMRQFKTSEWTSVSESSGEKPEI